MSDTDDLTQTRVETEDDQVNVLGDQDTVNTSTSYEYPPGSDLPTAQNVRRYPELFDQSVIDSFNVDNPDHQVATEADTDIDTDLTTPVDDTTVDGDDTTTRVTF